MCGAVGSSLGRSVTDHREGFVNKRSKLYRTKIAALKKARAARSRYARERATHRLIEPTADVLHVPVDDVRATIRSAIQRMVQELLAELA